MEEKKRLITRGVIAAVLGVIVVAIVLNLGTKKDSDEVDGIYAMGMTNQTEITTTTFCLSFDAKNGTYQILLGSDSNAIALESGTFTVDEDKIIATADSSESEEIYRKEGNYLIAADFLYEGDVPEDEKFDAICTYESSDGMITTITFCQDGTYTEESENGEETTSDAGSYVRDGNVIERTSSTGEVVSNYYIYNGRITNSFYLKSSES